MSKLLITGGAGYVGAHTVHFLLENGFSPKQIVVFDNLERGHARFVPSSVELVKGDLRNQKDVDDLFARHSIDAVIHFAAYAYVGESMQDPGKYFQNNLAAALNLLRAIKQGACRKFVLSSTCTVYGAPPALPITEDMPSAPDNPYGESKRCLEEVLRWHAEIDGIRSVCLRYFNAAGAGHGIGEIHEPETHLIPLVLQTALGQRPALTIYGDDYTTRDGTCVRDYVHVSDLADAHVRALRLLEEGKVRHLRVNLGTGHGATVREVLEMAEKISGHRIPVKVGPRRPGDPAALYADFARAREVLGWTAKKGLKEIIEDAWRWHAKHAAAAQHR